MAEIMITCPKTRKLVSTGMTMDKESFDTAKLEGIAMRCPACRGYHIWSKKDAILRE